MAKDKLTLVPSSIVNNGVDTNQKPPITMISTWKQELHQEIECVFGPWGNHLYDYKSHKLCSNQKSAHKSTIRLSVILVPWCWGPHHLPRRHPTLTSLRDQHTICSFRIKWCAPRVLSLTPIITSCKYHKAQISKYTWTIR